jgi:Spy/CpxP family protein refolding chaperone
MGKEQIVVRFKSIAGIVALVLIASLAARGEDPTSQPSKPDKKEGRALRLPQPWSKLTLTDDQKAQIGQIHQKANADVKAIRDKEEEQILSLLTEEQRSELKRLAEERKAEEKARRAEAKKTRDEPRSDGDEKKE